MKKLAALSLLSIVVLASCGQAAVTGKSKITEFAAQNVATEPLYTAQAGKVAQIDLSTRDTVTTLDATGLKPGVGYVAQYHAAGTDISRGACASAGRVIGDDGETTIIGNKTVASNSSGSLTIRGINSSAALSTASYLELHEALAPAVVPLCAAL